jgi:membrane protein DedA with SNARE-associated domain
MEWFSELLSYLVSGISLSHPLTLVVLFLLGLISELGFPLLFSIETFLFFISYDNGPLSSQAMLMVVLLLIGREAGSSVLYWIVRLIGSPFLDWLGRRSSWFLRAVEKFKVRVNKNPAIAVTLVRLTPGLLQVPSIAAGAIRLRLLSFAAGVALSSLIYDFILILLGFSARFALPHLNAAPRTYLFVGFFLLIVLVWLALFLASRRSFRS